MEYIRSMKEICTYVTRYRGFFMGPNANHDIFELCLTERPGDEGARSARKVQREDIMISLEET